MITCPFNVKTKLYKRGGMAQWVAHLSRIWSGVNFKAQSNALVESLSMKLLPLVLSWFQELILSSKGFVLHNQTKNILVLSKTSEICP